MHPGPKSSITLTTGAVSQRPNKGWTIPNGYATGLQGLTRGLALDLAPLRVNLVSPGFVDTELWDNMYKEQKEKLREDLMAKVPTGRVAGPEDVAEAYLYLMKDWNCTGEMVGTNSGALLVG